MSKPIRTPVIKPVRTPVLAPRQAIVPVTVEGMLQGVLQGKHDRVWDATISQLTKASPAFTAQELLTGPPEPPYYGRFLVGEHHLAWDELVTTYDRLCILAPRDSGKCNTAGTLLQRADGLRVKVEDWQGGDLIAWDNDGQRFVRAYAPPVIENGVKPIIKVVLASGRKLEGTEEHPLLMYPGWVPAKDIKVGDRVAVVNGIPGVGSAVLESPWLLGLLIGDASFLLSATTPITTTYPMILDNLRQETTLRGWELRGDYPHYRILTKGVPKEKTCSAWLKGLGIWGKKSKDKFVPPKVFMARDDDIAEFLAGYFDADGSIEALAVRASSTSHELLTGVQSLLSRLGIISAVRKRKKSRYKGELYEFWELSVNGGSTLRFWQAIPLRGDKRPQLEELVRRREQQDYSSGKSLDRFPRDVWRDLRKSEDWHRTHGGSRPNSSYAPTRQKVRRVAEQEDNKDLLSRLGAPVFWDEVVSIERKEPEMTYAIQVPKYHTFVANDVVNHNTYYFDFAYPIWKVINHTPGSREYGYIFSATQDMAERILRDIKDEFETNPKLRWLVPTSRETWRARSITLSNGHRIYARGLGTKIRGAHPTWAVVDDGLTDETAYSEIVRKKQIDYFYSAITNMITPGGQIIVVGTPFHKLDLYGDLKENPEYVFKQYQALTEKPNGDLIALWPERYPVKALLKKKREIGSIRFSRELQCDPMDDSASLFPSRLFKGDPIEQHNVTLGLPREYWADKGVELYMGVDFAMSSSVQADYTVPWVMGKDVNGNRWLVDFDRVKGMSYQDQLSLIKTFAVKYQPSLIFLEANQMQRIFGDELIRTTDLPIQQFHTGVQKHSLEIGLPSLRVLLENEKFRIPRGDQRSVELTDIWIDEMQSFTWDKGKVVSVGAHDDLAMACWITNEAIRQGGFAFSFGDGDTTSYDPREELGPPQDDKGDDGHTPNLVSNDNVLPFGMGWSR